MSTTNSEETREELTDVDNSIKKEDVDEKENIKPISEKKSKFCNVYGYELKTVGEDLIVKGYIATTHLDSGFPDPVTGDFVKDRITFETLQSWANEINSGNPRANKVSINHNRESHVAGVGVKGTASVDKLPDGEYGLYVETLVDKTREDFKETQYKIEKELLDSYSIEFTARNPDGTDLEGIQRIERDSYVERILTPTTKLDGWTLASQPMNENAIMFKEINNNNKEDDYMSEQKENKETIVPEAKESFSKEDLALLKEAKEAKEKEGKETMMKEMKEAMVSEFKESIMSEFKEHMKTVELKEKVANNEGDEEPEESPSLKEFKEVMDSKEKKSIYQQFNAASKFVDSVGMLNKPEIKTSISVASREFKNFRTNGNLLEYKTLGITTNSTDYTQSSAELNDVYDPLIYNTLNQSTVLWNVLQKDDYSSKGNDKVQFTVKNTANPTAGFYTGDAVSLGNTGREKNETKFKKCAAGIAVSGDMIAAARGGPIGDVFSQEVMDATEDMLSVMNQALFSETGAETAASVIGLPYLSDAAGNTTLYSLTRSSYAYMDGNSGATYINASSATITPTLLRQAYRQSVVNGKSDIGDLIFVCDYTQLHKFLGIYDQIQRTAPTSSRFGFEGRPEFDGIPVFADKDCKAQSWFVVNLRYGYRVAMWVPPTLEMLGKDSDSQKGFIKTYFATYSRHPNQIVEIYGAAA